MGILKSGPRKKLSRKEDDAKERIDLVALNFKVAPAFHREFKTYAAQHGLSMLELLRISFDLVKKRGKSQ